MKKRPSTYILFALLGLIVVASCKRTKDALPNRLYHEMISAYNILFNGQQALLQGVNTLESNHEDDYDQILSIFPYGSAEQVSSIKPDMERAIEKGNKAIKEHSMWIKGGQKNDLMDDSYLLIGQAHFFLRDYMQALEAFNYVIQQFDDSETKTQARLWAAKAETELENYLGAKERFDRVYRSKDLPKALKGEAFASFAHLELKQKRYTGAYQLLTQAIDAEKDKERRMRWMFIAGQLQGQLGHYYDASRIFDKLIKKGPPYELRLQAQLNKARYYDVQINDPEAIIDYLQKMLRDDKNLENQDAIYFVLASVYERLEQEPPQMEALRQSIKTSVSNQKQKAKSFLKLAEIYFGHKDYRYAQAYYDSTYQLITKEHPRFREIEIRKTHLGDLVANLEIIETQDSLLALAQLSTTVQRQRIEDIIARQRKADRERAAAEEQTNFELENAAGGSPGFADNSSQAGEFYFYNTALRGSGIRDFKNRYGDRSLQDNWRLLGKGETALESSGNGEEGNPADGEGGDPAANGEDAYDVDSYLANIPNTPEEQEKAHQKIRQAIFNASAIYREKLKDLPAAAAQLEDLLQRYPDFSEIGSAWYALFRMYTAMNDQPNAQKYRDLIFNNLPDSEFAVLIKNDGKPAASASAAKNLYVSAYETYTREQYGQAYQEADKGRKNFASSDYGPRFALLTALCQGHLGNREEYLKLLQAVVDRYPQSDQAEKARSILQQVGEAQAETAAAANKEASLYRFKANDDHKYVVLMPNKPEADANRLTNGMVDFSKVFYPRLNLTAKNILMGLDYKLVVVSGFKGSEAAQQYRQTIIERQMMKNYLKGVDYKHFVISNTNFATFYGKMDVEGYEKFFKANYQQ